MTFKLYMIIMLSSGVSVDVQYVETYSGGLADYKARCEQAAKAMTRTDGNLTIKGICVQTRWQDQ